MGNVQVSFRLAEKVYEDFSAKIKELGISKQSFYERAIDKFLNDSVAVDGRNTVAVGIEDVEKVVNDNLQSLAELVVKDGSFAWSVAWAVAEILKQDNLTDKVKADTEDNLADEVKVDTEDKVTSDDLTLSEDAFSGVGVDPVLPKLNDESLSVDGVIDEDKPRKKAEWLKLVDLPPKLTLTEVELAFDIPKTYLSKYKDKPEKLSRWEKPLSKLVKTSIGYDNPYSRYRLESQSKS